MYLETGLGQVYKRRSKYAPARLLFVTAHWDLEVPFRKDFGAYRQELSKAIRQLVTAETDKALIDSLLLEVKRMVGGLKEMHDRLLKRKSPKLKESDPVRVNADIQFNKTDYTEVAGIIVFER